MSEVDDINELLALSIDAVSKSAAIFKSFNPTAKQVVSKKECSREIKILADNIMEDALLTSLKKSGLDILSEECGEIRGAKGGDCGFIVDPLDGSYNFNRGIGPCAISIALWNKNSPVFGVIYDIMNDCVVWGGKSLGAHAQNGDILKVSTTDQLDYAVVHTGFPARANLDEIDFQKAFWGFVTSFSKVRMVGSAASSLLDVASGKSDCYMENGIMIWDVAAGLAIVQGAGGHVEYMRLSQKNSFKVLATNQLLASKLCGRF